MTDSDMGLDVMFEWTQWGMLRKRALFGPGCSESESPVSDVAEVQTGWPTEDDFPEGARSPGVGLADVVAPAEGGGMIAPERHWFCPSIRAGPGLRQQMYLCLRVRLVGISTDKCSRPLSVPMDGMM